MLDCVSTSSNRGSHARLSGLLYISGLSRGLSLENSAASEYSSKGYISSCCEIWQGANIDMMSMQGRVELSDHSSIEEEHYPHTHD